MFKRTLISVLAIAGFSCFAQSGPIGRAIKATQVILDPTGFSVVTNTVLQTALDSIDSALGTQGSSIAGLEAREVTIVKGSITVPGGAIIESPPHTYTIFFNTGGSGTNGVGGSGSTTMTPGSIITWPMDEAPSGWLLCDGSSYSTNTYADLFAEIGWRYSASEGTTFNVPDYRGRVLRGADTRISVDPGASNRVSSGVGGGSTLAGSTQAGTVAATNAASTVEARMPNTYVNWIIKYRDDTTYFMNQVAFAEGSTFSAVLTNGLLFITHPRETWTITRQSLYKGSSGEIAASTTNRTVMGYYEHKSATHWSSWSASIRDRRNGIVGSEMRVAHQTFWILQGTSYAVTFDVPAGYSYWVVAGGVPDAADESVLTTVWKP